MPRKIKMGPKEYVVVMTIDFKGTTKTQQYRHERSKNTNQDEFLKSMPRSIIFKVK